MQKEWLIHNQPRRLRPHSTSVLAGHRIASIRFRRGVSNPCSETPSAAGQGLQSERTTENLKTTIIRSRQARGKTKILVTCLRAVDTTLEPMSEDEQAIWIVRVRYP